MLKNVAASHDASSAQQRLRAQALEHRARQLDDRAANVQRREELVAEREAAVDAREAMLAVREAALSAPSEAPPQPVEDEPEQRRPSLPPPLPDDIGSRSIATPSDGSANLPPLAADASSNARLVHDAAQQLFGAKLDALRGASLRSDATGVSAACDEVLAAAGADASDASLASLARATAHLLARAGATVAADDEMLSTARSLAQSVIALLASGKYCNTCSILFFSIIYKKIQFR